MLERYKAWMRSWLAPPPSHERTEEARQQELLAQWRLLEEASARVAALQATVGAIIHEGVNDP